MTSIIENALISIIISALVTWYSSDRWVEKNRRKREHTIRLKEASIKPWADAHINKICQLSVYYDYLEGKVCAEPIKNYEYLNYNEFIERHIKTGYPNVEKKWQELRNLVIKCNDEYASIIEDIRIIFHEMAIKFELTSYYSKQGISRPQTFIQPFEVAKAVFREYENRINGIEKWHMGKPTIGAVHHSGKNYVQSSWLQHTLIITIPSDNIMIVHEKINEILNDFDYFGRIGTLTGYKMQLAESKNELLEELRKIIELIELGHNLKGTCSACKSRFF